MLIVDDMFLLVFFAVCYSRDFHLLKQKKKEKKILPSETFISQNGNPQDFHSWFYFSFFNI